jgi:maltose/moltooligosaccharide transporter
MDRPPRSNWQIWNMNFGFFGIQFGWGLQMAYMSAIYEYLGARADQIPILWLAAPLTGLLVQPIVGMASDRTWGRLGRRRPYFLAGAILSSAALILMPRCTALWMAAGLLWVLDASINISMQPFRAFVADLLPESQSTRGYAMQSLFIGLGAFFASALAYLLTNVFHLTEVRAAGTVPIAVRVSFYMGAAAFLGAVLWTVFTTKEYPPENLEEFKRQKAAGAGIAAGTRELLVSIGKMPRVMRQLAWVQICTWLGLFCMWLYFPVAVARNVFGAADTNSPLYSAGTEWAGVCFGMYSLVCFGFSFALPALARKFGRKGTHALCLICGDDRDSFDRYSRLRLRRTHGRHLHRRAGLNPLVLEGHEPGGQLSMTTLVENFPGWPEGIQGPELIDNMKKQAARFGATFQLAHLNSVDLSANPFRLQTSTGEILTRTLIVARARARAGWDCPASRR